MTNPATVNCQGCGRINGAAAKRCIWCGIPIINRGTLSSFETTRVDIGYVDGIERFNDSMAVRLTITPSGIVVNELMPGSRSFTIEADSIIEARVVDTSSTREGERQRASWKWWLVVGPLALFVPGKRLPETKQHDYMLTIRYRTRGQVRNAVFHREDRLGLSLVDGLARIINSIVAQRAERPKPDESF
ncbi:MAG TPA: hypothetical protein VNH22_11500 [Blastocatellia bacterium]|jgi:hypothetical protein|nr:hypothetical protein [Blastocatellia bacterium]